MTNQEILTKAIEKAIDNGWNNTKFFPLPTLPNARAEQLANQLFVTTEVMIKRNHHTIA